MRQCYNLFLFFGMLKKLTIYTKKSAELIYYLKISYFSLSKHILAQLPRLKVVG